MAPWTPFAANLLTVAIVALLGHTVHCNTEVPVTGIVGKQVTLHCDLPIGKPGIVRWTDYVYNSNRDPILIYDSINPGINKAHPNRANYMVSSNHIDLTIDAVNLDSAGDYFCESQIDATTNHKKTFQLTVSGMPQCSGKHDLMDGDQMELSCESQFSGADMPTLEWFAGDMALVSEDDGGIRDVRRIIKKDATWDLDQQKFICRMTFGEMAEECSITMDIQYRVRDLRFTPQQESYHVGQVVRCEASGNPAPKITLLPNSVSQKEGTNFKSIVIDSLWEGTQTALHCSASNMVQGRTEILSKNITFQVLEQVESPKPPQPIKPQEPAKPVEGGAQSAASTSTAAIIAGIVIGALVLVIVIVIIVCIRRRKGKKIPKGAKPIPTKEEDIRREMDRKA